MIKDRLDLLRKEMLSEGIEIYVIPTSDFHQSEYVSDYFKCREYMSGFTGSAGTLVVTAGNACLWTDGRYFLQAEEQLSGSGIELFRSGNEGVPTVTEYILDIYKNRKTKGHNNASFSIGFDGRVTDTAWGLELENKLSEISSKNVIINSVSDDSSPECYCRHAEVTSDYVINYKTDLVDRIWKNRPALPSNPIYVLEEKFTGQSTEDKLTEIRCIMEENRCDYHLLTSLDDIAWILNMRGSDIACNPVFLAYLLIGPSDITLFCNISSLSENAEKQLFSLGIRLQPYDEIYRFCSELFPVTVKTDDDINNDITSLPNVLLDSEHVNYSLYSIVSDGAEIVNIPNPSARMKAIKNIVEIENLRLANLKDGVAMVKFLCWLDSAIGKENLTEIGVADRLLEFRKAKINSNDSSADISINIPPETEAVNNPSLSEAEFLDSSFDTISGYGAHGAIVHYEPTPESDARIEAKGFLLIDSGAQYRQGTTDITRTISMGPLTQQMKEHYTAVLRGNLALASAIFPAGTAGANLDILARKPLWELGLDYNHGTGHGIGYCLNVHEGPQSFHWKLGSRKGNVVPLEPGMVITDEPGVYISGSHGIRTENDLLVVENTVNEFGRFYSFQILTLCPIDTRPIIKEKMTKDEISVFNAYHKHVFHSLAPYLTENERLWLENATKEI